MKTFIIGYIVLGIIVIGALVGEVRCIYKFCKCDFKPSYKAEIVYGVGVISGAGAILGWFNFGE